MFSLNLGREGWLEGQPGPSPALPTLLWAARPQGPRSPPVFQGLDVEAQRWGDGVNVFSIELLEDGCFASVVQAAGARQVKEKPPCSAGW